MHDTIFFNFLSISDFLCRFASWVTALQVVRTSLLGPRPRLFPPPLPRHVHSFNETRVRFSLGFGGILHTLGKIDDRRRCTARQLEIEAKFYLLDPFMLER